LANNLYVAMTRAKSVLAIYARSSKNKSAQQLLGVLDECLNPILERPEIEKEISRYDDLDELLTLIGREHKGWLEQLWQGCAVEQEPILTSTGKILAEPVFWFKKENQSFACFGSKPLNVRVRHNLEDAGIKIISPGEDWELAG
jgi:ATP-dependent exoDNAse (exonuclease V) beta subunit